MVVDVFRFGDGHYVSIDDSRNVVLNLPEGTQSLTLDQILNVWLFRDGNGASKVEIRFRGKGLVGGFSRIQINPP